MVRDLRHAMLAETSSDDTARQMFVLDLKRVLTRQMRPRNRDLYDKVVAPEFARRNGRPPETRPEAQATLLAEPRYQMWSSLARSAQEMMWESVATPIRRDEPRLRATYAELARQDNRGGSLELDPTTPIPEALNRIDIHVQPGGYMLDRDDRDIVAGALYEAGGNIYSMGTGISAKDSKAGRIIDLLADIAPEFRPGRILDMGCSAGAASCEWALAFPHADVHAIDVAPGILRYAHARARALGAPVHFHQMNAGATRFEEASFDLVVSHNIMHEIPTADRQAMFRESWRLVRPGGIVLHQDVPLRFEGKPLYDQVEFNWDKEFNGEPFWDAYADGDIVADFEAAGFPRETIDARMVDKRAGPGSWYVVVARKPIATSTAA